jgi:DNA-directed RNA polymerase subunit alpha
MTNFHISCIESRIHNPTNVYARFKIGPLEKNQTLTIANNLRRTLLSELESIAIIAVQIQGVKHEYSSIPGVRESVLDILLNIKQIVLSCPHRLHSPQIGYLSIYGEKKVCAGDIQFPDFIHCINPNHEIATLCVDGHLIMTFLIYPGKNYWLQFGSNQFLKHCQKIFSKVYDNSKLALKNDFPNLKPISNILPLDAVFMPIHRVNYTIESDESVDTEKSYENIFLEIWTNGSIHPIQAIEEASNALIDLFRPFQNLQVLKIQPKFLTFKSRKLSSKIQSTTSPFIRQIPNKEKLEMEMNSEDQLKLQLDIANLNISTRVYNSLKSAEIHQIQQLLNYSADDLLLLKNFGKRSLEEVENSLYAMGLLLPQKGTT